MANQLHRSDLRAALETLYGAVKAKRCKIARNGPGAAYGWWVVPAGETIWYAGGTLREAVENVRARAQTGVCVSSPVVGDVLVALREYVTALSDPEVVKELRAYLTPLVRDTGNAQLDYEYLRDRAEQWLHQHPAEEGACRASGSS